MSTEAHDQTHDEWWAGLSGEQRMLAIESIRLDQDPDHPHPGRPTGERAEWVRRRPEYLERFAAADVAARKDETGLGPELVPDAHERTEPIQD